MAFDLDTTPRRQERKQDNPLESLETLSKFVYRLNYTDTTSEDYVYYQIIIHLAGYGSFTVTELDKKIIIYKNTRDGKKKIKIERRKLKKILEGTAKDFTGLIPLNYVMCIPEWKNRGGNQEKTYYLTEKGIMASLGFYSYKKNINIKKILKHYKGLGKRYQKFIHEFIKLQIQMYLSFYFVQGLSLAFKKEHSLEYDEFRRIIINQFDIKIADYNLEKQFRNLLTKFNLYRKIHLEILKEKEFLDFLWRESLCLVNNIDFQHGFHGWYQIQFLTRLDSNLKQKKYEIKENIETSDKKTNKGIKMELVSEPEYLYSRFQEDSNISHDMIKNTMKSLELL